jgi:hypothetical protein
MKLFILLIFIVIYKNLLDTVNLLSGLKFVISSEIFADILITFMICYFNMISFLIVFNVVKIKIKIHVNSLALPSEMQDSIMINYMSTLDR